VAKCIEEEIKQTKGELTFEVGGAQRDFAAPNAL